jgi:hypothetical protein
VHLSELQNFKRTLARAVAQPSTAGYMKVNNSRSYHNNHLQYHAVLACAGSMSVESSLSTAKIAATLPASHQQRAGLDANFQMRDAHNGSVSQCTMLYLPNSLFHSQ